MKFNTEDFTQTQQKLYETLKFMSKLLLAGAIFQTILYIYPNTEAIQAGLAALINSMLTSTGINTVLEGINITTNQATYVVTQDCLGWKSIAAFTALVYASTNRTLEHINFILQGAAVIAIANVIRVYTTVILAEKGIISFQIIHDVMWKWSLTLVVLAIWLYWMKNLKDKKPIYQHKIKERVKQLTED